MRCLLLPVALACLAWPAALATTAHADSAERRAGLRYVKAFDRHTRTGYHQAGSTVPRSLKPLYRLVRGVPMVDYPGIGPRRNPTTTANWGLVNYSSWYRYRGKRQLRHAVTAADYLVRTQRRRSGRWLYRFDFRYSGGVLMRSPWYSALAQGQALSLLRRVYAATRKRKYLRAAKRGLRPFRKAVTLGGLVRRRHGGIVYEEYPYKPRALLVLNGFMQSLVGLYDVSDLLPEARPLYSRGMRTLPRIVREHRLPGGRSTYDLTHLTLGLPTHPVSDSYQAAHVGLLRLLGRLRPNRTLRRVRDEWQTTVRLPAPKSARAPWRSAGL